MANTTLGGILGKNTGHSVVFEGVDPKLFALITGEWDIPSLAASIAATVDAFAEQSTASILAACTAWVYQDEDAHEDCSLTACLNPLHPGPCKGWKGTLFKTAPGAFHSIEAAKAEKANTARLAKIADLKAKGLPIPKKLLTPIVPKAHPDEGKTAKAATGEAHAAGKAVSEAAGVKTTTPGKVTLGQAVKLAAPPKGAKGKKPTLASKGIAFVIGQEKVTPQYKLDKAAKITPEQWNELSDADKASIRDELTKIKKDGFGPQQKKADELLAKLPAKGLAPGTPDTITTPKGNVYQKVTLKDVIQPEKPKPPAPAPEPDKIAKVLEKAKAEPPKVKEMTEPADASSAGQAAAAKTVAEAIFGKQNTPMDAMVAAFDKMKASGKPVQDHPGFKGIVNKFAQAALKQASADKMPGLGHGDNDAHIGTFNKEIADHIAEGKPGLPPLVAKMAAHHEASKPENVKKAIEKAAKDAAAAKVAEKHDPDAIKVTPATEVKAPALADLHAPKVPGEPLSAKNYTPAMKAATDAAAAYANPPKIIALQTPFKDRLKAYNKLGAEEWKALPDGTKTAIVKDMIEAVAADQQLHQGFIGDDGKAYTPVSAWMIRRNIQVPALDQGKINKFVPQFAKDKPTKPAPVVQIPEKTIVESNNIFGEYSQVTAVLHPKYVQTPVQEPVQTPTKLSDIATPNTAIQTSKPPTPAAEAKLTAPPKHIQTAVAMANGTAPGASWSKNHLAAYQALSEDDFKSLPPDVQAKIIAELGKGETKFLDPKKVAAAKALKEKFQGASGAPKVAAKTTAMFFPDLNDHNVTPAAAKEAAAKVDTIDHFITAKKTAGLTNEDNPDSVVLKNEAVKKAKGFIDSQTAPEESWLLKSPAVKQAAEAAEKAMFDLKYAQGVQAAKTSAYNKIKTALVSDNGQLSPIQKASLEAYQKHLVAHPMNTDQATIEKLQGAAVKGIQDFIVALNAEKKKASAPAPTGMTPAQIDSRAEELLGPLANDLDPNLKLAELQAAGQIGTIKAVKDAEGYPPEVLEDPTVAAKYGALKSIYTQIQATGKMQGKVDQHIKLLHDDVLSGGYDHNGNPLTAEDRKVIELHKSQLNAKNSHIAKSKAELAEKAVQAKAQFDAAATKAQGNLKPAEPSVLTDYDKTTISHAYENAWQASAEKAVTFGAAGYYNQLKIKNHEQYPSLAADLKELKTLAGEVVVTAALQKTAELNIPTHPDTGALQPGPEYDAFQAAVVNAVSKRKQFDALHKTAQARLDAIRVDVGLKKRALPKIDSPGVKTAAAESAYYKTGGYSGPNYGKPASAKAFLVSKLGDKLAVAHKTSIEKANEKSAKLKASLPPMPPPKVHAKPKISAAEAGETPTAATAEKLGYHFTPEVHSGSAYAGWPGKGGAYVASPEALTDLKAHLTGPDTKDGIEAQKEFKWSIGNMEGKGAASSGKSALYAYTGGSYTAINTKLNGLPPGAKKTGSSQISSIDAAFAAAPPLEGDVVLYRGFSSPEMVFKSGKWNEVNVAGMEWSQRSYSSTSGALSTAQSFSGYNGVVMRVIIPKDMKVKGINAKGGQHPGENEIILERGIRYRVVADYGRSNPNDQRRYIDVMVVPNPYDQPE